jgi:pyruvate/2-oxoglutarate dehydrogenase complex dihydrolipoamide dehydrogenase (E3) component
MALAMTAHASDYDFVVLGGGPAGIIAAQSAAALGARTALIEERMLGGACLNTGCIPSKAMIRAANVMAEIRDGERYGARSPGGGEVDFAAAMNRVRHVRDRVLRRVAVSQLNTLGVEVHLGRATFGGRDRAVVGGKNLVFKKALIATGSRPRIPPIPGLAESGYWTNETIFDLTERPRRLLVFGGGPLGCELAQAFRRLGSEVIIVQREPMFLRQEERDAAQILSAALARDGVEIHLNTKVVRVYSEGGEKRADLVSDGDERTVAFDGILVGAGRVPNVEGLNLEAAGVAYDAERGVHVDDFLRTKNPRVFAAGDACLEHRFAHIEAASSRIVVRNALARGRARVSGLTIPWCTYTDPEIAHVGLYVRDARAKGIPVKTFTVMMHDVDRAIADGEEEGFVKIHLKEGTDRILGATVVARHAGEMISELTLAITCGLGLRSLARVIHPYPTQASAVATAAATYLAGTLRVPRRNGVEHLEELRRAGDPVSGVGLQRRRDE